MTLCSGSNSDSTQVQLWSEWAQEERYMKSAWRVTREQSCNRHGLGWESVGDRGVFPWQCTDGGGGDWLATRGFAPGRGARQA